MKNKVFFPLIVLGVITLVLFIIAISIGAYPITLPSLLSGDEMTFRVFSNLRLPRALMGLFGGFALGITGFVFQTVFRNPLASPDIAGVSSGASVGAAVGILFLSSAALPVAFCSFVGGVIAILFALALSSLSRAKNRASIVLAGIVVHSLAQTLLMILKLLADPEKELASIEYWIMGSLSNVTADKIFLPIVLIIAGSICMFLLFRHTLLLAVDESEAKLLGVSVNSLRVVILLIATLVVSSVISVTGLISFIGLLAPHIARLLIGGNKKSTLLLSGITGSFLLLGADCLAKSLTSVELPVSIFTSLLGAPFLVWLLLAKRKEEQHAI